MDGEALILVCRGAAENAQAIMEKARSKPNGLKPEPAALTARPVWFVRAATRLSLAFVNPKPNKPLPNTLRRKLELSGGSSSTTAERTEGLATTVVRPPKASTNVQSVASVT
jgi:hypothetical protein